MISPFKLSAFLLVASAAGIAQAGDHVSIGSDVAAPVDHLAGQRSAGLYGGYGYGSRGTTIGHGYSPTRFNGYGYRDNNTRRGYGYGVYGPTPRRSYSNYYAPTPRRGYVGTSRRGYGYGADCRIPAYRGYYPY